MGNNPVISIISQYRESSIAKLLNWHRQSGLTKMAEHLNQLKSRYQNGLKGEDIEWIRAEHKIFWERVLNRAEPDLVSFLFTVTENQVRQMERKLIERNDWLVKQVKITPKEAHASTLEWFFGLLEDWLGDLEPDQKQQIADWVKTDPEWTVTKLENRKKSQTNLAQLLRANENLPENVHTWIHHRKPTGPKPLKTGSKIRRRSGKKLF